MHIVSRECRQDVMLLGCVIIMDFIVFLYVDNLSDYLAIFCVHCSVSIETITNLLLFVIQAKQFHSLFDLIFIQISDHLRLK